MFHQDHTSTTAPEGNCFRLILAYDGTGFYGWQVQPGFPTVQGTLAEAIRQVTGETVLPQGSGRTDTGVHAAGQTVSMALQARIPADRLLRALNRKLPSSIRIMAAQHAAPSFHARAGVLHKTYEYRIFQRRRPGLMDEAICPPAVARYAWDCRWPLHVEPMNAAAVNLRGTHDFTSFAATDPDRTQRQAEAHADNTRTVFASAWHQQDEHTLVYRVTGTGFLHHMVRNIVGTCVLAGAGRLDPAQVPSILSARDRRRAGPTAPPQGLHLIEVVYRDDTTDPLKAMTA